MDDTTWGGYLAAHGRPPAFEGPDGAAYSVDVFADEGPSSEGQFGAAVLFVRWSETGSHPIGHLETPYLVFGATADEAVAAIRRLTLRQLKGYLDELVADQQQGPLR